MQAGFVCYTPAVAGEANTPNSASEQNNQIVRRIHTSDAQQVGIGHNIAFVEQLINQSSAAKQIIASDNAQAKALREKAIKLVEAAKQAQNQGDQTAVNNALNKAKKAIFEAIRLSRSKSVEHKHSEDFKQRIQSTKVLLEAHKRISEEKNLGPAAQEVKQHVENELEKANALFKKGQTEKAEEIANAAYLSIKISVTRLREGDTLVRSLHFETKKDEYEYELERNKTHKVLVNVVLKDKLSPQMQLLMKIPMKKAEELRQQAIHYADEGKYQAAIKTLEDSTQQIIRAIRMGGIFIPG